MLVAQQHSVSMHGSWSPHLNSEKAWVAKHIPLSMLPADTGLQLYTLRICPMSFTVCGCSHVCPCSCTALHKVSPFFLIGLQPGGLCSAEGCLILPCCRPTGIWQAASLQVTAKNITCERQLGEACKQTKAIPDTMEACTAEVTAADFLLRLCCEEK